MSTLSNNLERLRNKKGWSKVEVSRRLGMKASSTYSNWEYGNREPDLESLQKIADLYNVTLDYLLGKDDNSDLLAAHIDDDVTEEEMIEIEKFIKYLKSQRDE